MKAIATTTPPETTASLKHQFTKTRGKEKTIIKPRLNDECKNGYEDFSLTCDIYDDGRNVGGGCNHEHILALMPELAPFAALHLSTWDGVPMYAAQNGWYWFQGACPDISQPGACHGGTGSSGKAPGECKRIFMEHVRATPAQFDAIKATMPRSQDELQHALETLGFPAQWKREAEAAIKQLEQWTGQKFQSCATRKTWEPLTAEKVALINERKASGWYEPENVAKRDEEARKAAIARKVAEIKADHARSIEKLDRKLMVALYFASRGMFKANVIYYDHTNEISFNWSSCDRLWTEAEFEKFKGEAAMDELPENVTFKWQARNKY